MLNILKRLWPRKQMITPEQIEQRIRMVSEELEALEKVTEFADSAEAFEHNDRISVLNEVIGFLAEDKASLQDLMALNDKTDVESLCNHYIYGP